MALSFPFILFLLKLQLWLHLKKVNRIKKGDIKKSRRFSFINMFGLRNCIKLSHYHFPLHFNIVCLRTKIFKIHNPPCILIAQNWPLRPSSSLPFLLLPPNPLSLSPQLSSPQTPPSLPLHQSLINPLISITDRPPSALPLRPNH